MKVKTSGTRQGKKALPYGGAQRPETRKSGGQSSALTTTPSGTGSSPLQVQVARPPGAVPLRQVCLEHIAEAYPGITPRDDADILELGTSRREGSPAEIFAWLDEMRAINTKLCGSEQACQNATMLLDTYVEPTGKKPHSKSDPLVFSQPIPDSQYSIRLFPGSLTDAEYCMDFIDTATGEPVNSPFEFELWAVPNPETPWLSLPVVGKLHSIERSYGLKQEDIRPGAEKFVLRDGLTCMLSRPGKRPVRFTVPVRRRDNNGSCAMDEVDVLDFPKVVG
ncbi:hypothetical protein C8Q77DRAFT_1115827 [Trametes polyzona]|nr:hypothetical protein C8Q77DRAFT_1115827 [Trametes polyzona]